MAEVQSREWRLRSLSESLPEGRVAEGEPSATWLDATARELSLSPITLRVCWLRGLRDTAAIQGFLNPRLDQLTDPFRIRDMDRAVERLVQARDSGEAVRVFGDYDVDGTSGAALFTWILREWGFRYDVRQPDRFKDGYGLNVGAVEDAAAAGVKLLVTVDCGITSHVPIKRARELGVDVIVVDHHQLDVHHGIPADAVAVVNPQRADCPSGLKQLCGCGLAFYVARALRARGRELGWWPAGQEPNLKQHLDLVVMATAADMVPLTGDNHILVRHGLEVLKASKKPGVRALLETAGVATREISPGHLGFVIGPRINASGRMGSALGAWELLTTEDPARGRVLAQELERVNQERAETQNAIWDQVRARVEEGIAQGKFKHGIVVADPGWHEGVVGIVASRVTEMFHRPAAVIALREDFGKGSVRSFAGKDVLQALRQSSAHLLGFGGHRHAAGLSCPLDQVDALAESFDRALGELAEDAQAKPLWVEGECSLADLDFATLRELEALGPFGPGNPEPVFVVQASARRRQILKGRHFKLQLTDGSAPASSSGGLEAIWFHAAEREELLLDGVLEKTARWAGVPELNRFQGRVTPTFRVRDWRQTPQ